MRLFLLVKFVHCSNFNNPKSYSMKKVIQIMLRNFGLISILLLLSSQAVLAQSGSLKGIVNDDVGNPVPGVNVIIEGTSLGTTTDISGNYFLRNIPLGNQIIKISYVGFKTITTSVTIVERETLEKSFSLKEDAYSLQEVEVTASKRSERIQDVAITISAITAKGIEEMGINDANDYLTTIPGLYVSSRSPDANVVNMRGVAPMGGWAQTVGYYLGETPLPFLPATSSFDVERMEVLRGPQGTLYGEGSMGGTIKIIPTQANPYKIEAMINPEVSSTTDGGVNYNVNGMVNIPIIKDKLAIRATGNYRNDDGFINNIGTDIDNNNTFENFGGRISAKYYASDKFRISASAIFNKSESGGLFVANEDLEISTALAESGTQNYQAYSFSADYDFSFASLNVSGTYYNNESTQIQDLNTLLPTVNYILSLGGIPPRTALWTNGINNNETYSAEARLVSSGDGPFKWTTGLYYKDLDTNGTLLADTEEHLDAELISALMEAAFGIPGVTELYDEYYQINVKQVAIFGEVRYDITPKLNVLAGLRFMNEKRHFENITGGMFPILISGLPPELRINEGEENVINPKFVISYKALDNILIYANASRGFRSGGQNLYTFLYPGSSESYDSETLWNYELGVKSTLLEGKLIANAAFYYNDWKDMQVITRSISDLNLTENVGKAHTAGIDAEISWLPIKGLLLNATANYAVAEIDTEIKTPAGIDPDTGEELFTIVPSGTQLQNIPKFSFNLAAQYKFEFSENTSLTPRAEYNYKGKNVDYYVNMLDPIDIPSYGLTNLRLTFQHKSLGAYVFANNVTNEKVLNGFYAKDPNPNIGNLYKVGRPRTIGLGLRYYF